MPYTLKICLAITLTLGGAILTGVTGTLGYLLGGSYMFGGVAFIALCASAASATWWSRLVAERVESDCKALLEARAAQIPPKTRAPLPGEIDQQQQRLVEMLNSLGHTAVDAMQLTREISQGMGEIGVHLAEVEADKSRFAAEAEKVREIVSVATRAAKPRKPVADEPVKPGPEAYGMKRVAQPEEGAVVMPSFLRTPPRLVEQPPAKSDRLKVDLAEIEEAIKTAAPVG